MRPPSLLRRLPTYLINGIGVAIGVALVQLVVGALGGHGAALLATSGAIYASLPDQPLAASRTWRRVLLGAVVGCGVAALAGLARAHPATLGALVALAGFGSAALLAWGPRAGPVSMVGVLAIVFTLAAPPPASPAVALLHAGWSVAGAGLYLAWAYGFSRALQPRYRTLALALAFDGMAGLLRSRAAVLVAEAEDGLAIDQLPRRGPHPLEAWIADQTTLDERLQAARDLLFAAPVDDPHAQRQTGALLQLIELRDSLLASELDLGLLGRDAAAHRVREQLARPWHAIADTLAAIADALRESRAPAAPAHRAEAAAAAPPPPFDDEVRQHSMAVLADAARHMDEALSRIQHILSGSADPALPPRETLQTFVSVEGLPLAALKPHARLGSPVLRHGVRAATGLTIAYCVGLALPWASHPHWLVLSVAVVLRGNLSQTLSRLNARVSGTVMGCLLVLGLAQINTPWLSTIIFLVAVGVAHAYVISRYRITAMAASVMALLQAHLSSPAGGFAVPERLAETVLGALLAWACCYVLPTWERRAAPRAVERVTRALARLSEQVLRRPPDHAQSLDLRLARRETYDALGALALLAQRTAAEPESVRVPTYLVATLLAHGHALLAQLAAIKLVLQRRADAFERHETEAALLATAADILQRLGSGHRDDGPDRVAEALERTDMPWLRLGLQRAMQSAAQVQRAAAALRAVAR